uniref:Rep-A_N domain-containing protein n=1 Tax=Ascaris lumbricoides TaxID=6252 RepID=A0A0M3I2A5_ASCLU
MTVQIGSANISGNFRARSAVYNAGLLPKVAQSGTQALCRQVTLLIAADRKGHLRALQSSTIAIVGGHPIALLNVG